jgi:hypothetical protein
MGCDYYTYYVICIEYKKGDTVKIKRHIVEDTRKRHYFYYDGLKRDDDFEEEREFNERCRVYEENQIQDALSEYTPKQILKDGKWLCIPSAQEKYTNICKEYDILPETVIAIWKEGGCQYR